MPTALDRDEVLRLLDAAKKDSARSHAMVLLSIRHGMRASEVCALKLEDFDLKEGWVRIRRLKGSLTTVQILERHPGVPLLDEVRTLTAYVKDRHDDGSGIVFTSTHGGAMDRSTFFRLWKRLAEAAGLPPDKQHPHVAKHTCGTLLAKSGASAFHVRQHLGHRSISSSQVYCTVSDRDASAAARTAFMQAF